MKEHSAKEEVQNRIAAGDTSLFDAVFSQTSQEDRRSLLSLQGAVSGLRNPYRYLEIGSHLGGSIQPYLLDSRCAGIISIDKRPLKQRDERGGTYQYPEKSTLRMMENLQGISPEQVGKIITFDEDTGALNPSAMPFQPDACFIDGEHTDEAVLRDFKFCLSVVKNPGLIYFHDSQLIFRGLRNALQVL